MLAMMRFFLSFSLITCLIAPWAQAQVMGGGQEQETSQGNDGNHSQFESQQEYRQAVSRYQSVDGVSIDIAAPGAAYPACFSGSVVYICKSDHMVVCIPNTGMDDSLNAYKMQEIGCKPADPNNIPHQDEIEADFMGFDPVACAKARANGWLMTPNKRVIDSACYYAAVVYVGPGNFKAKDIDKAIKHFVSVNHIDSFKGKNGGHTYDEVYLQAKAQFLSQKDPRPAQGVILPPKPAAIPQAIYLPPQPVKVTCDNSLTKSCPGSCNTKLDYEEVIPNGNICFDSMQCTPRNVDGSKGETHYFLIPADFINQDDKVSNLAMAAGCNGAPAKIDKRDKDDIKAAAAKNWYCYNKSFDLPGGKKSAENLCPFGGMKAAGMPPECTAFDISNRGAMSRAQYCALVDTCAVPFYKTKITSCNSHNCNMESCYTVFENDLHHNVITQQQLSANNAISEFTLGDVQSRSKDIVNAIETLRNDANNAATGPNTFNTYFNSCYFQHVVECRRQNQVSTQDGSQPPACTDPVKPKCDTSGAYPSLDKLEKVLTKFAQPSPTTQLDSYQLAQWKIFTDVNYTGKGPEQQYAGLLYRMGNMGGFSIRTGAAADDVKIGKDMGRLTQLLEGMTQPGFGQSQKSMISAINSSMQVTSTGQGRATASITFAAPEGNNAVASKDSFDPDHCLRTVEEGLLGQTMFNEEPVFMSIKGAVDYCSGKVQPVRSSAVLPPQAPPAPPEDGGSCPCWKPKCKNLPSCRNAR